MKFFTKRSGLPPGGVSKLLLVMRFTIILLFTSLLQVSAGTYGQQVTLNNQSITIKEVFKAIKVQTGYDVLWQPNQLDASKRIDANFINSSLEDVLRKCISTRNFTFKIEDQSIIIKQRAGLKTNTLQQDSVIYRGRITDENGKAMAGATVKISGSRRTTFTTAQGDFSIYGPLKGTLEVTYLGYQGKQLTLNGLDPSNLIRVKLVPGNNDLGEVNIVSTGYQEIAKERATGSFEVITSQQLQHSSDPNLIKRLEGITTSLDFNNNRIPINTAGTQARSLLGQLSNSPLAKLTIRGKNTLNTNQSLNTSQSGLVLVVIDGVPSPYSIDNVNPNDVENITILKDAAAASIWGSRAANGVIVVKTKKGKYNRPMNISFNSNFNLTEKLDLFYNNNKTMTPSEYIDAEIIKFNQGNTYVGPPDITYPQPLFSPIEEILGQLQNGEITSSQANKNIDAMRGNDVRNDFDKYILRNAFTQSYSIAADGGGKNVIYRLSAAYDNNRNNTVNSDGNRLSLTYNTSVKILKDLELNANINYTQSINHNQADQNNITASINGAIYPYTRLADNEGNHLAVANKFRPAFLDLLKTTYGSKIQDLSYIPLDDLDQGYSNTRARSLNFNLGMNYQVNDFISLGLQYNYNQGNNLEERLNRKDSFYMRELTTFFTDPSNFNKQIPLGALYRPTTYNNSYHSLRGQLNINKNWGDKHVLNGIVGMDASQVYTISKALFYYGYDEKTLTSNNLLNFTTRLNTLYADPNYLTQSPIPYIDPSFANDRARTVSTYANLAYTLMRKYTISGSVRRDLNSQFGMGTNKGGTPFYSLGSKWDIAAERFYKFSFIPKLQLRATFGYNGNVNAQVSARPLLYNFSPDRFNGLPTVFLNNVTNYKLRPEKTAVTNIGVDFGFKNNRITGSLEYYDKRTTDLIASNPLDYSSGFATQIYNTANMHGWGTDLNLSSQNLRAGIFSWDTQFLFSYNRVKISKLYVPSARTAFDVTQGGFNEGYDLSRLFAFRWAGLDPLTGNPMGYFNGNPKIINTYDDAIDIYNQPISSVRYFGSSVPVYYGSLRNTFRYGAFLFSANILYKLGYYFRRSGRSMVQYSLLYDYYTTGIQGSEYSQRWQKPGDENITRVPSAIYPGNSDRDNFYYFSEINVQKADHIRLQEINLSYSFGKKDWVIKNPRIYANISNLGIIWRANKLGLDPDISDYPNPKTYSFGFSANF